MSQISIDDKVYELETLSDAARLQLANVQITDAEIQRLQRQIAIAQTARSTYAAALKNELPADTGTVN